MREEGKGWGGRGGGKGRGKEVGRRIDVNKGRSGRDEAEEGRNEA